MSAAPFPLQLEQLFFTRSVVLAVSDHKPNGDQIGPPDNSININKIDGMPSHFEAVMRSTMNLQAHPDQPYVIDMEAVAIFAVDATLSEEEAGRGVTITGHSVLFGAIRESVAWLTSRQPYGAVLLGLSVLPRAPESGQPTEPIPE